MRGCESSRGRVAYRRGFTLLEVALTMAVLIALAAMLWPNLSAMRRGSILPTATDDLHGLLVGLRVRAMEESREYSFAFQPETGQFRVSAANAETAPTTMTPPTANTNGDTVDFDSGLLLGEHQLQETLVFVDLTVQPTSVIDAQSPTAGLDGWFTVRFRPVGTAQFGVSSDSSANGQFAIVDESGVGQVFEIRGLTGAVNVSPRPFRVREERSATGGRL